MLLGIRPGRRWEQGINCYFQSIFNHGGDETGQVGRAKFETRISVNLYQPGLEVLINHEVVPEDFKSVMAALRVQLSAHCLHSVSCHLLQLRDDIFHNVHLLLNCVVCELLVQVFLEINIGELVSTFEAAVVVRLLLNCVIGQMDEPVLYIFQRKLLGRCAHIPLVVPVALKITVTRGDQNVAPDVEFAPLKEQRLFNVLLNYVTSLGSTVGDSVANDFLDLLQILAHVDPASSVGVLSRLHDPQRLAKLLWEQVFVSVLENFSKLLKFFVMDAFLYMEGVRDNLVPLDSAHRLVEHFHVVVESFFVGQMEVVFNMIILNAILLSLVSYWLRVLIIIIIVFLVGVMDGARIVFPENLGADLGDCLRIGVVLPHFLDLSGGVN